MRKTFLTMAALLTLAGCAGRTFPLGEPIVPPRMADDALVMADGARLPLRHWLPDGPPKAVILALHGMNDYSNAFDEPGRWLAAQGIAVYAWDQRGFGQAPHPGYWSSAEAMAEDLRTAIRLIKAQRPQAPLFVLGESMGGAVAIAALADHPAPEVRGVILSAPALWGRDSMPVYQRAVLWLAANLAPGWELTGRGLHIQASDNIPMLRKLSADPLVIKETRVDAIEGLVDLMDEGAARIGRLDGPVLVLYGAKDQVIPPEPTWAAVARLPNRRVALYRNGWHMLLRDLHAEAVLADIAAWVQNPNAPLGSGAEIPSTPLPPCGRGVLSSRPD